MQKSISSVYETSWNAKEYLQQYYSTEYVSDDEQANFESMAVMLQQAGYRFKRALEVGCGPTLHHAFMLAPHTDEIHLSDYLPENLNEIQKWLHDEDTGHNWDVYLRGVLEIESRQSITANDINARKQLLRSKITNLQICDLREKKPLKNASVYDLVVSFYCAEAITASQAEWRDLMSNLCSLIAPGGTLLLSALRKAQFYTVMGKTFPTACIDEADLASVLQDNEFEATQTEIKVVKIAEWIEQGFDSICIVKAKKA